VGSFCVRLGYVVAIVYVMGGLAFRETSDVPIQSVDVQESDVGMACRPISSRSHGIRTSLL
jgi:hypothetical protein